MNMNGLFSKATWIKGATRLKQQSILPILIVSTVLTSGCSTLGGALTYEQVKPWQRGALADEGMQPVLDTMDQSVDDHIYFSREASTGGGSVRGGGCGCN